MVSFTTITRGIFLITVMSFSSTVIAAPAANITSSSAAAPYTLPPIIASRAKPVAHPAFAGDTNAESVSIVKNKKWFTEHGGNFNNVTKRDSTTVGGMTMDLPANAPPIVPTSSNTVVIASSSQVSTFKLYAGIASTSYCQAVIGSNQWNCANCLKYVPDGKLLITFSSLLSDTNGFVLRSDSQKVIHLVFRGTNSIRSAITDLVFDLTNYSPVSGAQVHAGFYSSYNQVVSQFFPVVQAQLTAYPDYKVMISGHSLGGAQALLAGMDLYQRDSRLGPQNLQIYTVGCPRVGNPAFAYYVDSTGISFSRSVNNRDIVPHLPPQAFGYLHPGVEAWDLSYTNVQVCTANIETNSCSNSIVPFTSFTDHLTYYGLNEGLCL